MNLSENILEIRNLRVSFPNPAVNRANFDVRRLSFTALVGESGSGKSVTALSIGKLLPADALVAGEIRFLGKGISYVFQDPSSSLNPVMAVGRQIGEAYACRSRASRAEIEEKVSQALRSVRMRDAARVVKSFPHELSGGMKQRAMIAMALISGPELLIADEPTASLDAGVEVEILELLARLRRERSLTVLFITHNLPLAMRYADAIAVMEKGDIVELLHKRSGCWEEPREPYTRRLFSAELLNLEPKSLIKI